VTALPEHPVSHRLALMALCGDLVVAIDAMAIREIRRADETPVRAVDGGLSLLELDGELGREAVPAWDLGELLGIEAESLAWAIVELPGLGYRIGLGLGRCVTVQSLPVCRAIPRTIFASRPYAIAAGFSTVAIPELADHVSGVVIDLSGVFNEGELAVLAKVREGREAALQA
jgi:hypothetical protein